jgi:anthranilate/para-aminobenzoate synthase component I
MAAGLFGYLGYDMVRQVEHLPNINPDPIGTPDAIMTRPTLIAIFDQIAQEIILTTTARATEAIDASVAYKAAQARLEQASMELETAIGTFRSADVPDNEVEPLHGATCAHEGYDRHDDIQVGWALDVPGRKGCSPIEALR